MAPQDRRRTAPSSRLSLSGSISRRQLLGASGAVLLGSVLAEGGRSGATTVATATNQAKAPVVPVTVVTNRRGQAPGHILLTPMASGTYQHGPMIVDNDGQLVWMLPLTDLATNLQVQTYKGEPVLTWWRGVIGSGGYGEGLYRMLDTSYRPVATVRAGNGLQGDLHEFTLTPEGTALITAYLPQSADLTSVGGSPDGMLLDAYFQEVDVATGQVLFQWQASQHVDFTESYAALPTPASTPWDWFHINSVSLAGDGNYLISSRHLWCVMKIDRSSGTVLWRINGKASDFTMGDGAAFSWQHHARIHPGHVLTVFDDGAGLYKSEAQSRGLKLQLDPATKTCNLVQAYLPQPIMLASYMGSVQLLPNGNVFVGWGARPRFSEYTADGELLYNAKIPKGDFSYRAFRSVWPAPPG